MQTVVLKFNKQKSVQIVKTFISMNVVVFIYLLYWIVNEIAAKYFRGSKCRHKDNPSLQGTLNIDYIGVIRKFKLKLQT